MKKENSAIKSNARSRDIYYKVLRKTVCVLFVKINVWLNLNCQPILYISVFKIIKTNNNIIGDLNH